MPGTLASTFSTASPGVGSILPPEFGQLITRPLEAASLAFNPAIASSHTITAGEWRIPVVAKDPSVGWVAEGQEIEISAPELEELSVTPRKLAGLSVITRELANDSNPAAQSLVGEGLARDLSRKVDSAFFGSLGAPAPAGLASVTGTHTVDAGTLDDLDPLAQAVSLIETSGHAATGFVTDPATALKLATMKSGAGSNLPLLADPRTVLQRPVLVSADVAAGTIWALSAANVHAVIRDDIELAVSTDAYFSSDRVALRATLRIGFGFSAPESIAKITVTPDDNDG